MATATHAGRTIISDIEGGWNFVPGGVGNEYQVIRLARSTKLRVKDLGKAGCTMQLSVDYAGSSITTFVNRISDLYNGTIGTLSIPGNGSYSDTILTGTPSFTEPIPLQGGQYLITCTMEILKL